MPVKLITLPTQAAELEIEVVPVFGEPAQTTAGVMVTQ